MASACTYIGVTDHALTTGMQTGNRVRLVTGFWRLSAATVRSPCSKKSLISPAKGARHDPSSSVWTGNSRPYSKHVPNRGSPFLSRTAASDSMMGNKESRGGKDSGQKDAGEYVEAVVAKAGELKDGE